MWKSLLSLSLAASCLTMSAEAGMARISARSIKPNELSREHHPVARATAEQIKKKGVSLTTGLAFTPFVDKVGWCFNHFDERPQDLPDGIPYYPMLFDDSQASLNVWDANARREIGRGNKVLFGFPKPRYGCASQELDTLKCAKHGAGLFTTHLTSLLKEFPDLTLVSPAAENLQEPEELTQFMTACSECSINAVAVEWAGVPSDIEGFKAFVKNVHDTYNLPIWVTSFSFILGVYSSAEVPLETLAQAMAFMDSSEYVHGYAASLLDLIEEGATEPNAYGQAYIA